MTLEAVEFVVQELHLQEPPTVTRAIWYRLGVLVLQVLIGFVVWKLKSRFRIGRRTLDLTGLNALRSTSPGIVLARHLPWDPAEYPKTIRQPALLDDLAGHRYLYGLIVIDATSEELLFRGVPLLAAITLGFSPFTAVAIGTFIWAIGHEVGEIPSTLLSGAFYVWLWLGGAWYLAIAFHVFTNCFGHTLGRVSWWAEVGRYPA